MSVQEQIYAVFVKNRHKLGIGDYGVVVGGTNCVRRNHNPLMPHRYNPFHVRVFTRCRKVSFQPVKLLLRVHTFLAMVNVIRRHCNKMHRTVIEGIVETCFRTRRNVDIEHFTDTLIPSRIPAVPFMVTGRNHHRIFEQVFFNTAEHFFPTFGFRAVIYNVAAVHDELNLGESCKRIRHHTCKIGRTDRVRFIVEKIGFLAVRCEGKVHFRNHFFTRRKGIHVAPYVRGVIAKFYKIFGVKRKVFHHAFYHVFFKPTFVVTIKHHGVCKIFAGRNHNLRRDRLYSRMEHYAVFRCRHIVISRRCRERHKPCRFLRRNFTPNRRQGDFIRVFDDGSWTDLLTLFVCPVKEFFTGFCNGGKFAVGIAAFHFHPLHFFTVRLKTYGHVRAGKFCLHVQITNNPSEHVGVSRYVHLTAVDDQAVQHVTVLRGNRKGNVLPLRNFRNVRGYAAASGRLDCNVVHCNDRRAVTRRTFVTRGHGNHL